MTLSKTASTEIAQYLLRLTHLRTATGEKIQEMAEAQIGLTDLLETMAKERPDLHAHLEPALRALLKASRALTDVGRSRREEAAILNDIAQALKRVGDWSA